ncbi:Protein of unknown function [Natronincola peptidivorans]|uniref:DUF2691 domain-containing protein n=1 Tax=Natronincola peptidivorans TaxID=426128 RepID=A0A1I0EDV2_9FIRM|nr:DUF2691 family protein [Natronincola peptidivorans]SET43329.1 Protein of unknown function [Natronincola peptidivorans]
MDKRGLRFSIPNGYGSIISEIFAPIDVTKYIWHIENDEIYLSSDRSSNESLFSEGVIAGGVFDELIRKCEYYVVFGEFKAFPKESQVEEISIYDDFIRSNCSIILLIADCTYVDIYCKDQDLIDRLHENAVLKRYTDIEVIGSDDSRTSMYVW